METPVEEERARCIRCVEASLEYAKSLDAGRTSMAPGAEAMLIRIANQIRSGGEPLTMDEQMRPEE
jgi:hypothetical protein